MNSKKSNSSDANIFSVFIYFFFSFKVRFQVLKFEFCQIVEIDLG